MDETAAVAGPASSEPLSVREAAAQVTADREKREGAQPGILKVETPDKPTSVREAARAVTAFREARAEDQRAIDRAMGLEAADDDAGEHIAPEDPIHAPAVTRDDPAPSHPKDDAAELRAAQERANATREQYKAGIKPQALSIAQAVEAEWPGLTAEGLNHLMMTNPPEYARAKSALDQLKNVTDAYHHEERAADQEDAAAFNEWAKSQDKAFADRFPDLMNNKDAHRKVEDASYKMLRDLGFAENEISAAWSGKQKIVMRDARVQSILADAACYRLAREAVAKPAPREVPRVQRPGTASNRNAGAYHEASEAQDRLKSTGKLQDAVKSLQAQRRARSR